MSKTFQSTLPARGATLLVENNRQAIDISIHAPRTGSDDERRILCRFRLLFQSTLPARGATLPRVDGKGATMNFNPRSPHGERHVSLGLPAL